jgi:hypothetical protein
MTEDHDREFEDQIAAEIAEFHAQQEAISVQREAIGPALDLVADYYHPRYGRWAYAAFAAVNAAFFDGRLPQPLIQWAITPYGACLGRTGHRGHGDRAIITLHPSIVRPVASWLRDDREPAWGLDPDWFGPLYALDVLIHEAIHVAQFSLYGDGGWKWRPGRSSHNCESWIAEVNRLAPLWGMEGVEAGLQVPRRVPIPGEFTKRGKPKTKVVKVDLGNVPLSAHGRAPSGLREHFRTADAYYRGSTPTAGIVLPWIPQRVLIR